MRPSPLISYTYFAGTLFLSWRALVFMKCVLTCRVKRHRLTSHLPVGHGHSFHSTGDAFAHNLPSSPPPVRIVLVFIELSQPVRYGAAPRCEFMLETVRFTIGQTSGGGGKCEFGVPGEPDGRMRCPQHACVCVHMNTHYIARVCVDRDGCNMLRI